MQRLFSMFPKGGPGVGLLLLRLSVATCLHWLGSGESHWWLTTLTLALGAGLLVGFATPFVCVASIALASGMACLGSDAALHALVALGMQAISLFLLGPGAYSIDAILFGRRLVEVKPRQ